MFKHFKLFSVLVIFCSLSLAACSSNSSTDPGTDNNNGGSNDGYFFEANVAGTMQRLEHGKDGYKMTVTDESTNDGLNYYITEHVNFSKYDANNVKDETAPSADLYFFNGPYLAQPTSEERDSVGGLTWDPNLEAANVSTQLSGLQIEWREAGKSYGSDRKGQGKPGNDVATITYHQKATSTLSGVPGTYDTKGTFKAYLFTGADADASHPLILTNGKFSVRNSIH